MAWHGGSSLRVYSDTASDVGSPVTFLLFTTDLMCASQLLIGFSWLQRDSATILGIKLAMEDGSAYVALPKDASGDIEGHQLEAHSRETLNGWERVRAVH